MDGDVGSFYALGHLTAMKATTHRRINAVQPRTHFAGPANATDPTERAVRPWILDAVIGNKGAEAISSDAT